MIVSATIVIYQEQIQTLEKVISSFNDLSCEKELIIIDNSPTPLLQNFCQSHHATYIFPGKNIGFGAGHNLAFSHLHQDSDIHLILNPDIIFDAENIHKMLLWFFQEKNTALATAKTLNTDGSPQYICRNLPTPLSLFMRRLNFGGIFTKQVISDELGRQDFEEITEVPFCHGCFMMFKSDIYKKLQGFDECFFMYMEDADIFIRAKHYGKTVLNPHFSITHEHRKGSAKSIKLLIWHITSAIKFFWKHYKKHSTM